MIYFFYRKKNCFTGVVFFILTTLSACGKNKKQALTPALSTSTSSSKQMAYNEQVEIARRIDTPAPIGFTLKSIKKEKNVHVLRYAGKLPLEKALQFYYQEMERQGWSLADLSTSSECLLFCEKTSKHCAVHIIQTTDKRKPTAITLYIKEEYRQSDSQTPHPKSTISLGTV